jgi:hypothetical protein
VVVSTTCWSIMLASLLGMACVFGPLQILKMYGIPYIVSSTSCLCLLLSKQLLLSQATSYLSSLATNN